MVTSSNLTLARLLQQNEFLTCELGVSRKQHCLCGRWRLAGTEAAGWAQGEVIALVPDLISVLESETGRAIGTEELKYGERRTDTQHPHSVQDQWLT